MIDTKELAAKAVTAVMTEGADATAHVKALADAHMANRVEQMAESVTLDEGKQPKWEVKFKNKEHKPVTVVAANTAQAIRKAEAKAKKDSGTTFNAVYADIKKLDEARRPKATFKNDIVAVDNQTDKVVKTFKKSKHKEAEQFMSDNDVRLMDIEIYNAEIAPYIK